MERERLKAERELTIDFTLEFGAAVIPYYPAR